MTSKTVIEDKFGFYLASELRRQNVPNSAEWLSNIECRARVRTKKVIPPHTNATPLLADANKETKNGGSVAMVSDPLNVSGSQGDDAGGETVFKIDLTGMEIDDKIAVAVAEVLVKLHVLEAQLQDVAEWQLLLQKNELTDLALKHMELIAQVCPRLTRLDLRQNHFTEPRLLEMLQAVESSSMCHILIDPFTSPACREAAAQLHMPNSPVSTERRSVSVVSSSVATSRISFTGGNAESLRRRREELFSKNRRSKKGKGRATSPEEVDNLSASNTHTNTDVPDINVSQIDMVVDESPSAAGKEETTEPYDAATPPRRKETLASVPETTRRDVVPPTGPSSPAPRPPTRDARAERAASEAAAAAAADAASREPFTERHDHLDVTANLNPILDSVLDLSSVAGVGGQLQHPAIFGGAQSVWEIIEAYETAVEQSSQGSSLHPNTTAKLPSALIGGGMYNMLTVLCLRHNHLRELQVLPSSLLRLDVSSNELTTLDGLQHCKMLTVLNARRNQIERISGLEKNRCMAHLFLGHNRIKVVEGLAHLLLLETLDLTYNELKTQNAVRALSLCPSLHHVLVKGNAVVDKMSGGHVPVFRNLCPTLLVIDDVKVSNSRFADALLSERNALRQPNLIDTTFHHHITAASVVDRRLNNTNSSCRKENGDRETPEQQAANVLFMITQGVTAPTGYGDASKAANSVKLMTRQVEAKKREEEKKKRAQLTEGGRSIRVETMKQLAEESKKYLEATIVERMMQQQQQHMADGGTGGPAHMEEPLPRERKPKAKKSAATVKRQPLADVRRDSPMSSSAAPLTEEELLQRYEPTHFKASKPSSRQAPAKQPAAATAGEKRKAASAPQPAPHDATVEEIYELPVETDLSAPTSYAAMFDAARRSQERASVPLEREKSSSASRQSPPRSALARNEPSPPPQVRTSPPREASRSEERAAAAALTAGQSGKAVVHRDPLTDWPVPQKRRPSEGRRPVGARQKSEPSAPPPLPGAPNAQAAVRWHNSGSKTIPKQAPPAVTSPRAPDPVRIDSAQRQRVRQWYDKMESNAAAVQEGLQTIVHLLRAHRQKNMAVSETNRELPRTYIEERERCIHIIQEAGLLDDIQIPMEAVLYYGFAKTELQEGAPAPRRLPDTDALEKEESERNEVLRVVRLISDAKTCLRYIVLLVEDGRERLLQEYVEQVYTSL